MDQALELMADQHGWVMLLERIVLACVLAVAGVPKLKPASYRSNVKEFRETFKLKPAGAFALVNVLTETVGAAMILLGLFAELVALLVAAQMLMGILIKRFRLGADFRSGWSYDALLLVIALNLATAGPGVWALWPLI